MHKIATLVNTLYREEVMRACPREQADKLLEGSRLVERACRPMAHCTGHQHPELDEAGVPRWQATRPAAMSAPGR